MLVAVAAAAVRCWLDKTQFPVAVAAAAAVRYCLDKTQFPVALDFVVAAVVMVGS